jgi:hypothetical protein
VALFGDRDLLAPRVGRVAGDEDQVAAFEALQGVGHRALGHQEDVGQARRRLLAAVDGEVIEHAELRARQAVGQQAVDAGGGQLVDNADLGEHFDVWTM